MRIAPIAVLLLVLATACKKEDTKDSCFYSPAPRVGYNSWPSGLNTDSTFGVVRSSIPMDVYAVADGGGNHTEVHLVSVNIRLIKTANDSVLYAEDRAPDDFNGSFNNTVSVGPITADIPATLRIQATNKCGFSDVVVRHLRVMPD
ncbi:MAG: hypothetical protein IPI81_16905 [Flavobacteriales bacterium]|nr:hypothetical protein [Flavobacteriales bacterium]MCC6937827.1 hypothetical protein [Flavobacteriales bacterium]